MVTNAPAIPLPDMPPIGLPESQYARLSHSADKRGDVHAREAYKVGQYVTLALDPKLRWPQKLRYFQHALHRHTNPPPLPEDTVWMFYRSLASLIRDHAGEEALRLASREDDVLAKRIAMGCTRSKVEEDATAFFIELMGHDSRCPEHFHEEDWDALRVFRNQWV
ncbi:MAG TPA: hypothetical protein VF796_12340 [Humisphaera sp.]